MVRIWRGRFGRPSGARGGVVGQRPRVPSAAADSTLGYFRSLRPGGRSQSQSQPGLPSRREGSRIAQGETLGCRAPARPPAPEGRRETPPRPRLPSQREGSRIAQGETLGYRKHACAPRPGRPGPNSSAAGPSPPRREGSRIAQGETLGYRAPAHIPSRRAGAKLHLSRAFHPGGRVRE